MKACVLSISDLAADSFLTTMFKTGYESNRLVPYRIIGGLPSDAKLVDCKVIEDHGFKIVAFLFESESFPDVEDPWNLPSLTIRSEIINDRRNYGKPVCTDVL